MACAAVLFGGDLGRSEAHMLVLASLSLIVSALLFTRAYRLHLVRADVSAPERVTVGEEVNLTLELHNEGTKLHRRIRIELPHLPSDGAYTLHPGEIDELPPLARKRVVVKARFTTRGQHQLEPVQAVALLPLGLSQGAAALSQRVRFMVVPKVARVVSLNVPQHHRQQSGGVSRSSRTGDATDLLGVRPYRIGDPLRDLHARSWARHGAPMVREYQEEYFTRIGVVVDTDYRDASPAHLEGALSLAAGIVARLCRGEAMVDILMTCGELRELRVGRSSGSLEQTLDILAAVPQGARFAADTMLIELGPHLPRLSSVVFVALSWDDRRAAFVSALEARGVSASVFVVADDAARSARVTHVTLSAITAGTELVL